MVEDGILVVEGNQYTTLALISLRREVGWARSDQSAGHAKPWYHVCDVKCYVLYVYCPRLLYCPDSSILLFYVFHFVLYVN